MTARAATAPGAGPGSATGAWLFPLVLVATLVQNYFDLMTLLTGGGLDIGSYTGPIWLKVGKDVVYGLLLVAIAVQALRLRRAPVTDHAFALLLVLGMLATISLLQNGAVVAAIGVRWALPFLLFILLGDWAPHVEPRKAALWLLTGVVVCLAAQVYQLFNMPPVFGEVLPGIPARTPGIFIAPNSTAFFACASAAAIRAYEPDDRRLGWAAVLLALGVSLLAQSGTGIVAAAILVLQMASARQPALFWVLAVAGGAAIFLSLDRITQRDDYVALSGGGRVEVFLDIVRRSFVSIDRFGIFTNAANLQVATSQEKVASDSLVASWIGNLGIMALPAAVLTVLFVRERMRPMDWRRAAPCLIVFALFAMTTIVFEAFPMNLYLALGLWAAVGDPAAAATPVEAEPVHG